VREMVEVRPTTIKGKRGFEMILQELMIRVSRWLARAV
jgi:hypothetical protein